MHNTVFSVCNMVSTDDEDVCSTTNFTSKVNSKRSEVAVGQIKKTPTGTQNETIASYFIRALLTAKKFPKTYANQVAQFGWRKSYNKRMGCHLSRWIEFCIARKLDIFQLTVHNILGFLQYLFREQDKTFGVVRSAKSVMVEMRKLAGMKITPTQQNYIKKFLRSCFNYRPPIKRTKDYTWDVNMLLDLFSKLLPHNHDLPPNALGGKVILLTMLTSLARKGKVLSLKLSQMRRLRNGSIKFRLDKPTKTYTMSNYHKSSGLQFMTIPRVQHNSKLCPVLAIEAYIEKTEIVRRDIDEVFILFQDPSRPAKDQTVSRWCKDLLHQAGITGFGAHSARGAMTSASLIRGVPISVIVNQAGWSNANTFVKKYLKPIQEMRTKLKENEQEMRKATTFQTESGEFTIRRIRNRSVRKDSQNMCSESDSQEEGYENQMCKAKNKQFAGHSLVNVDIVSDSDNAPTCPEGHSLINDETVSVFGNTPPQKPITEGQIQCKYVKAGKPATGYKPKCGKVQKIKPKDKISFSTRNKLQSTVRANIIKKGQDFEKIHQMVKLESVP